MMMHRQRAARHDEHRLLAAHAGLLHLAFRCRVAEDGVSDAPQEECLAQGVEEPLAKLVHGQAPDDELAGGDERESRGDAPNTPPLVHEIAQDEPYGLERSQGEEGFQLRVIDRVELGDGVLHVLAEVFVLEDEGQIEEVEQQHN